MNRRILLAAILVASYYQGKTQQIDSIFFNLYTDSLKKGTHNYINVDGKTSAGNWLPLTSKELILTASAFQFSGNELIVPSDCQEQRVTIKAILRTNPGVIIERTVWVKQKPDPDLPPANEMPARSTRKSGRRN